MVACRLSPESTQICHVYVLWSCPEVTFALSGKKVNGCCLIK